MVGIHLPDIMGIVERSNRAIRLFQIFVSATIDYADPKYAKVIARIKSHKLYVVVHCSYAINLANNWNIYEWWIEQMIGEIRQAHMIGASSIVVHCGKHLHLPLSVAINNMYSALLYVCAQTTEQHTVRILIETPAGQGSEILANVKDLCWFMKKFYTHPDHRVGERFGVCLDTCHLFATGYDLTHASMIGQIFEQIDKIIGIDKVSMCHLNDSANVLGSRVDRHANLGKGYIGAKPLKRIARSMHRLAVPIVLETPSPFVYDDLEMATSQSDRSE